MSYNKTPIIVLYTLGGLAGAQIQYIDVNSGKTVEVCFLNMKKYIECPNYIEQYLITSGIISLRTAGSMFNGVYLEDL